MQLDLFDVYTVDQHTLAVLRSLASFGQAAPEDDRFATAREVWPTLRKPELLLLAGLFHDIAKGRGGDHSEVGAEDAQAFRAAHALPAADTALVVWLVRQHLLMSITVQRQRLLAPHMIHPFHPPAPHREPLASTYIHTIIT